MTIAIDEEMAGWLILLASTVLVILTVGIHYEMLRALTRLRPLLSRLVRGGMPFMVLGLMVAHTIEIFVFGAAYYVLDSIAGFGSLQGAFEGSARDYVYFSGVVYTTLGFGDLVAVGAMRTMAGIEALTGLLMIGWSTSFTFLQMQRHWGEEG